LSSRGRADESRRAYGEDVQGHSGVRESCDGAQKRARPYKSGPAEEGRKLAGTPGDILIV
jgi:hypothetical protein